MNKKYANAAVAVLLALGINACSSGGGSANNLSDAGISTKVDNSKTKVDTKKSDGSDSYTSTIIASEEEIAKRKAEIKAAEDKAKEEAAQKAKEEAEKLAKEEAERQAEAEKAKQLADAEAERLKKLAEAEALLKEEAERQKKLIEDENARKAEEERLKKLAENEEAKKAEEARLKALAEAEAAKKAEEARLALEAEAARQAEEARLLEEAKAKQQENESKAKADLVKNGLLSSMFNQTGSESYAYLNDQAKKEILLDTLKNDKSACKAARNSKCASEAEQGSIIFSDYQSYSGYAVIRENASLANIPNNAYVAVVDVPTTEKAAVPVDAIYKGSAVYTTKQGNIYTGYTTKGYNTDLTLKVKDSVVSGDIKLATGKKPTVVEFENANIQVANNAVVFEGKAVFNTGAPLSLTVKNEQGEKLDKIDGSYRGQFAGRNAEEVVGTFETDSKLKEASVQGAFMGKQVETEGK